MPNIRINVVNHVKISRRLCLWRRLLWNPDQPHQHVHTVCPRNVRCYSRLSQLYQLPTPLQHRIHCNESSAGLHLCSRCDWNDLKTFRHMYKLRRGNVQISYRARHVHCVSNGGNNNWMHQQRWNWMHRCLGVPVHERILWSAAGHILYRMSDWAVCQ